MNYFVTREGQQYGPYSLADLQRYLAQGNIQPTDLARSEGLDQWVSIQQIVGNIVVQQPPPPSSVNYGHVPVYSQGSSGAAAQPEIGPAGPVPPGLHWALVLVLSIVTFSIFAMIWMFVEAAYAQKLQTKSKPLLFYGIGIPAVFASGIMSSIDDVKTFAPFVQLAGGIMLIAGHFSIKNALEDYYNRVERIHLQLSGPMTFFFNLVYFQYHLSQIRKWKLTGDGAWSSGVPSFRDAQPQKGVVYTQTEIESMRDRPPQQ